MIEIRKGKLNLSDADILLIIEKQNKGVKLLQLHKNKISGVGLKHISLCQWPDLLSLYLDYNQLKGKGLKHFALNEWGQLRALYMGMNDFGMSGMAHLSKSTMPMLTCMFIGGNKLRDEGVLALMKGNWSTMQFLSIYYNEIGVLGKKSTNLFGFHSVRQINMYNQEQDYILEPNKQSLRQLSEDRWGTDQISL